MNSEPQQQHTRIVVGVDGSEQSQLALHWAAQLAPSLDCLVEAVIAWHYPSAYAAVVPEGWDPEHDAKTALEEAVDAAFGENRPNEMRLLVRQGLPAKVLLDAGVGARMLIVGSRGHGGFTGLLLGSVSGAVAEHAPCPVLVVHPTPPRLTPRVAPTAASPGRATVSHPRPGTESATAHPGGLSSATTLTRSPSWTTCATASWSTPSSRRRSGRGSSTLRHHVWWPAIPTVMRTVSPSLTYNVTSWWG